MRYLFFILTFTSIVGFAQQYGDKEIYLVDSLEIDNISKSDLDLIDSCVEVYKTSDLDTVKFNAINTIIETSWDDKVWAKYNLWFLNEITTHQKIDLAYKQKMVAGCLINEGYYQRLIGNVDAALMYYDSSYHFYEILGIKEGLAYCLNNKGVLYDNLGNLPKALECYQKSLELQELIDDKEGLANSLSNIGEVYRVQEDLENALIYIERGLKIQKEINYSRGIAMSMVKLGDIYREKEDYLKALEYFNEGLTINRGIEDNIGIASALREIGILYLLQSDFQKALNYNLESLDYYNKTDDVEEISKSYNTLSTIYFKLKDYKKAEEYARKSYQIAHKLGYTDIISSSSLALSSVYEVKGIHDKALKMFKQHISMKDSVKNERNKKLSIRNQLQYEYDKQKAIDEKEKEKQLALSEKEKHAQLVITLSAISISVITVLFVILLIKRLRITNKQKLIIEETNEELNQINEELALQRDEIENQKEVVENKNREITDSITYAKRIQDAILPSVNLLKQHLDDYFVVYKPKDIVAGDFYWLQNQKNILLFAAADCTGHGVPGAMVSVVCHNAMNRAVREFGLTEPGLILDKTREIVVAEFEKSEDDVKDGMDIALCSLAGSTLQYAGANNPIWIIRDGEIIEIKADKQPIGKFEETTPYVTHTIELQASDSIYIFTDGYTDQFGGKKDKKFGSKRFKELLLTVQGESMKVQEELLIEKFKLWMNESGAKQLDDVCVFGIRVK